ncbi:hypothetical protein [Streptomyces sp. N50]|uniref:hypothetical protein n=1 Tax=Streptomyces sp. N50 TaxID=3081765 RepID=UPI0029624F4E|nr:hypothetical protein [Streptomyces sp. N50]WOX16083.1 hypothetical protein R2B38_45360 [Streptomyces sp. N50]
MTVRTVKQKALKVARTGWSKARHRRGKGVRTCVPAVDNDGSPATVRTSAEGNIVRGED